VRHAAAVGDLPDTQMFRQSRHDARLALTST
jgi:hypothetical protein